MILLKQLKNVIGARSFSAVVHQSSKSNWNRVNLPYVTANFEVSMNSPTNNGTNIPTVLRTTTSNLTVIRHHYRNYEYHPSRIVRAYRKTRTWLTDYFVLAENRFENIYSFSFLVVVGILFILVMCLNLQLGGEAGDFDANKLPLEEPTDASK